MKRKILVGPFSQILTMENLPRSGTIKDEQLKVVTNGGILIDGQKVAKVLTEAEFEQLTEHGTKRGVDFILHKIQHPAVAIPGLIDCHTHICYAGTRAQDYARRLAGETYLEIAKKGGGMMDTVRKTRATSEKQLFDSLFKRGLTHLQRGVTTCEVKSGYGLEIASELKMLRVINSAKNSRALLPDLIPTCLAAHTVPPEFSDPQSYLNELSEHLLPQLKAQNLTDRIDIFIEDSAFEGQTAADYLKNAKEMGFQLVIHADQFTVGGSKIAAEVGAISADHLEVSGEDQLQMLKDNNVIAVVLPGSSIGLGLPFAPARKMLDMGLSVAIASDWNPGSAPMGDLLPLAIILGSYEKLTIAETLAGITVRSALALGLEDRGILAPGNLADVIAFKCEHYQEIIYNQGSLHPFLVYRKGKQIL